MTARTIEDESLSYAEPGVLADGPLTVANPVGTERPEQYAFRSAMAATIKSETEDTSFTEAWQKVTGETGVNLGKALGPFKGEADIQYDAINEQALQLYVDEALSPESAPAVVESVQEQEMRNMEGKADPSMPYRMYVESMSGVNLSPLAKQQLANRFYFTDIIHELANDITGWETTKDIALEIAFAPKFIFDNWQVTGEVNPFESADTIEKIYNWFEQLPPEKQREMFPIIKDEVVDKLPRGRAVEFLTGLIDPAGREDVFFEFGPLGALDTVLVAAGIVGAGLRLRKALNPIKAASEAGDKGRAAEMNMHVLQGSDEQISDAMDVPRLTAANNAGPFKAEGLDDAADDGLSAATTEAIYGYREKLKQILQAIDQGETFVKEGFLDDVDVQKAIRRVDDMFDQYAQNTFGGKNKMNGLEREITADGVTFKFDIVNPDGTLEQGKWVGKFTLDDQSMWMDNVKENFLGSAKQQAKGTDFMASVNAAIRLDNTSANVGNQFRRLAKEAGKRVGAGKGIKGRLNRKAKIEEVEKILLAGDDLGKEFKLQELRAGVNGIKLEEDQIEFYYNMRGLMNGMWLLRDSQIRRGMQARGVKELNSPGMKSTFGEVVPDVAAAKNRVKNLGSIYRFTENGEAIPVNRLDMEMEYANGWRLARLDENMLVRGNRYQHVLVKSDDIGELPAVVTHRHEGYVPRVNPNGLFFVHVITKSNVDGLPGQIRKTVRSFDLESEANEFAAALDLRKVDEGFSEKSIVRVLPDTEAEALQVGDTRVGSARGLIHSPRSREPVPHGPEGETEFPRMAALEAIELYLENTKNFVTRNEWRMGMQRKWERTAEWMLGERVPYNEPGVALKNEQLRKLHEKIQEYSGFQNKSERIWENAMVQVYQFAVPRVGKGRISNFVLNARTKDPAAALRSVTFHSMLGMFNPIQWWVQAQGAAVAVSTNLLNPARQAKVFGQVQGLTFAQHIDILNKNPKASAAMAKLGYKNLDELKATKALWDKTGLYDSAQSSADIEAAMRGYPTTSNAFRKALDSGLFFFRTGELFNRRIAFLTALDEAGGALKVGNSDQALKAVMTRANDLILNLGKANRAGFQKGLMSVPTQFMQIQTKTIETLLNLNGVGNMEESLKLLFGQMLLYGSAGMLLGTVGQRAFLALSGKDQIDINEMDPKAVAIMNGGLTDLALRSIGADVTGAERGALINGFDQTILSFFTEEMTPYEMILGPSAVPPTRFYEKFRQLSVWFARPQSIDGDVNLTGQNVTDALRRIATGVPGLLTSPLSSASQFNKFMLMRDLGVLRDKRGSLIADPANGFNRQTEWATLIGFKPEEVQRKFDMSDGNQEVKDYINFRTDMLMQETDRFLMALEEARAANKPLSQSEVAEFSRLREFLINTTNPDVRYKVSEQFDQRFRARLAGESQMDRQIQTYYNNIILDLVGELTSEDTRLYQTRESE